MNLRILSNETLLIETERAAINERKATADLLEYLGEVERRKLYDVAGFSSLFDYCERALKMSSSQAARRVNATRSVADLPELKQELESGRLNLTVLSQAHSSFEKQRRAKIQVTKAKKREVFEALKNKSSREAEKIILKHSELPPEPVRESVRLVTEDVTEIKFGAETELLSKFNTLKDKYSLTTYKELFEKMADLLIAKAKPRQWPRPQPKSQKRTNSNTNANTNTEADSKLEQPQNPQHAGSAPDLGKAKWADASNPPSRPNTSPNNSPTPPLTSSPAANQRTRYIPEHVKREVRERDLNCCTYENPLTGLRCGSKHRVQFDHITPYARGGAHTSENLRLRCFAHNQMHARQSYPEHFELNFEW